MTARTQPSPPGARAPESVLLPVVPEPRVVDYLRVSVTSRCNERCLYCRPRTKRPVPSNEPELSADQIVRVVRVAAGLGFRKIRLTGGEPLLRADIATIAAQIRAISGIEALGVSTNGQALAHWAPHLRRAGVRSLNISLDALEAQRYETITGGDLDRVLEGVRVARREGFEVIKLNCVLLRGLNDDQLWPLAQFGAEHDFPVRFIELMPFLPRPDFERHYLSVAEAMRILGAYDELEPVADAHFGHGPGRYCRLRRTGGLVGFVGAVTCPHFCAGCNRLRLTADGKLRPCLGQIGEIDLVPALRGSDAALEHLLQAAIRSKPDGADWSSSLWLDRSMCAIGG